MGRQLDQDTGPRRADEVIEQSLTIPVDLRGHVMVAPFQGLIDWARKNSIWPVTFGLACCAIEYIASQNSRFDLARFGMEVNRASPRQADIMIVSGTVTVKMAHAIRRVYDQMADPKYVIAMGVCHFRRAVSRLVLNSARRGQLPASRRVRRGLSATAGCAAVRHISAAEEDLQSPAGRGSRSLACLAA
jgi:NADH-quinone oxidoreductase B subunit